MKILIVSDTHRKNGNLNWVLKEEKDIDRVIHLGDSEESWSDMQQMVPYPLDIVSGNNDFLRDMPREKEITLGKYQVLLTHGHFYYVSLYTNMLEEEAHARGFDIVMFGHTHRPEILRRKGVILLNPGSLSYPRQEGRKPSYIVMTIDDATGEASFEIKYVE